MCSGQRDDRDHRAMVDREAHLGRMRQQHVCEGAIRAARLHEKRTLIAMKFSISDLASASRA